MTPIQRPSTPTTPTPQQPATPDYAKLAELLVEKMAGDDRFKSKEIDYEKLAEKCPKAPTVNEIAEAIGPIIDGKIEKAIGKFPTNDELTAAVMAKMPAFVLQFTDKNGQVVEETPFTYNAATNRMTAKINPLTVETYDADGKFQESESYPLPWAIRLKPIIIPPQTKGT